MQIQIDEINISGLDNDAHLKYPRRTQRKIGDEIIKLSNPDKTRSLTMQKIKSNGSKIEQIIENQLHQNNIPFTKPEFIIDHIEGRKKWKHGKDDRSDELYSWIKRNNFPKGFQTLCMNCNHAKGDSSKCPHQK